MYAKRLSRRLPRWNKKGALGKSQGAFALLYGTQKALRKPCLRSAIA